MSWPLSLPVRLPGPTASRAPGIPLPGWRTAGAGWTEPPGGTRRSTLPAGPPPRTKPAARAAPFLCQRGTQQGPGAHPAGVELQGRPDHQAGDPHPDEHRVQPLEGVDLGEGGQGEQGEVLRGGVGPQTPGHQGEGGRRRTGRSPGTVGQSHGPSSPVTKGRSRGSEAREEDRDRSRAAPSKAWEGPL